MTQPKPEQFNERFTIGLNADGQPVERALAEMTVAEVLAALDWHDAEADRLWARCAAFAAMVKTRDETGEEAPELAAMTPDGFDRGVAGLRESTEAYVKAERLTDLMRAMCPVRYRDRPFQRLHGWWRAGRAA